jgi:hypothetical protein
MSIRHQIESLLDEYEQGLKIEIEARYEDQIAGLLRGLRDLEGLEQLLQDIGIDPALEYSTQDRQIIRDRLAGLRMSGILA